jgi:hypothetical protein
VLVPDEEEDEQSETHQESGTFMVIEEPSIEVYGAMADDFLEGCLVLDSGASLSASPLKAADDIQLHRLEREEPGLTTTEKTRIPSLSRMAEEAVPPSSPNNRSLQDYLQAKLLPFT